MGRNDYWFKREQKWIKKQLQDDALINKKIELQLNRALVNIQKDIANYYAAYAKSQNISLADAMTKVKQFDVKAFEATAKQMVESKDFSALANERLKLYNATMRINQLEYLKSQVGMELVDANSNIEKIMGDKLTSAYQDEVKRQAGILNKHRLNDVKGAVNSVVNASFQGATWSQRIWANNDNLKSRLEQLLTKSMVQGINPKVLARDLSDQFKKEFNNSRYMAERLMRTETARVQDEAQRRSFEKNGIEYVVWVNEPDACENCIDIANANDGIYPLNKVPGIPVHANCRCSKAAYVPKKGEFDPIESKVAAEPVDLESSLRQSGEKVYKDFFTPEVSTKINEYQTLKEEASKWIKLVNKEHSLNSEHYNKAIELQYQRDEKQTQLTKFLSQHNAKLLSKYRPVGYDGKFEQQWQSRSNKQIKSGIEYAHSYLPSDWYNKSKDYALLAKKANRGYYSDNRGILAANTNSGSLQSTIYHELGHRMEHLFPKIQEAEYNFYTRRVGDEPKRMLNDLLNTTRYGGSEVARLDHFLDPYMGKDYGNTATSSFELLSMGIEALYTGSYNLTKDKDYATFILGILLKL